VLIYAYRKFEKRVSQLAAAPGAKSQAVRLVVETFSSDETFRVSDLEQACSGVSRATIRRALNELREKGHVECLGTGRWAQWRKI
jgi:Fic family protein